MIKIAHGYVITMLIAVSFISLSERADADDWIKYYGDKRVDCFYDGKSLKATGKGVFQVWGKGIEHDANGAVKVEQPTVLLQVDCRNNTSDILGIYKKGMMSRVRPGIDNGLPAIPEAASQALRKKICK